MTPSHKTTNICISWVAAPLIMLAIMSKYLFMSTRTTLWDRDEPRFARSAVEMVQTGNYLVPSFNGQIWPDKPPFFYWLMSLPIRLLGPTELACRFFSVVGTGLTCLLTFFIGQRLLGTKAALWAMVILASTLLVLATGSAATCDAVLMPFIVGAMAVFAQSIGSGTSVSSVILIGVALGFGMLTKGPIGLMPIPAMATILWFDRKTRINTRRDTWLVGAGLAIGLLIFAAWAIPANSTTSGEFLRVFIGRHVITRALKPMEHHGGNFLLYLPYYLPVIIAGFFPWTLHLPGAFSAIAGGRIGGKRGRIFLASWIIPTFIIMSLAATKLPHYILFIWPGLALAVAGTIDAARQNSLTECDRIWLRRGVWFFGPLAIAMALGLMMGPWFLQIQGLRWSGLASGIVLLIMAALAIHYQRANRPAVSAEVLLAGMFVFEIPVLLGILPAVEQIKISPPIARAVNTRTAKDVPVATYKYSEPTLNFYIGRQIEPLRGEQAVVAWAKQPGPGVLIIPNDILSEIQQHYGTLPLDKIVSKKGFNYSKGKALEVVALTRRKEGR
jgi:4-amino-4-deoxy-L-arabinose transferase-like glycosyltransferase